MGINILLAYTNPFKIFEIYCDKFQYTLDLMLAFIGALVKFLLCNS